MVVACAASLSLALLNSPCSHGKIRCRWRFSNSPFLRKEKAIKSRSLLIYCPRCSGSARAVASHGEVFYSCLLLVFMFTSF